MLLRAALLLSALLASLAAATYPVDTDLIPARPDCRAVRCAAPICASPQCTACSLNFDNPTRCCESKCTACAPGFKLLRNTCVAVLGHDENRCAAVRCARPQCPTGCKDCKIVPAQPSLGTCCPTATCRDPAPPTVTPCPMFKCAVIQPKCDDACLDCQGIPNTLPGRPQCRSCGWARTQCRRCKPRHRLVNGRCALIGGPRPPPNVCPMVACLVAPRPCDRNCQSCRTVTPNSPQGCPLCPATRCLACKPGFQRDGENRCVPREVVYGEEDEMERYD